MTNDSAGTTLQRYTATYSALSNRSVSRELDGGLVNYGYDLANQLDSEERIGANAFDVNYVYDKVGNRTRKVDLATGGRVTSTYNAANELTLTQKPGDIRTSFTYDGNGNTLSEDRLGQVTQYAWDYENRLIGQVEPDGSRYTYTYRGNDSRRVKNETPDGMVRNLVWDELNCLQELDGGPKGMQTWSAHTWHKIMVCAMSRLYLKPPAGVTSTTLAKCMTSYCTGGFTIECAGPSDEICQAKNKGPYCAVNQCVGTPSTPMNAANIKICIPIAAPCCNGKRKESRWNLECGCRHFIPACAGSRGEERTCMMLHEMFHGCGFCDGDFYNQVWVDALACCSINYL